MAHAADVEPDGDVDLLVYDVLSDSFDYRLLRNQGNGTLVSEFLVNKVEAGNLSRFFDLDDDGDLDIVTCEENAGPNSRGLGVIWYENPLR